MEWEMKLECTYRPKTEVEYDTLMLYLKKAPVNLEEYHFEKNLVSEDTGEVVIEETFLCRKPCKI